MSSNRTRSKSFAILGLLACLATSNVSATQMKSLRVRSGDNSQQPAAGSVDTALATSEKPSVQEERQRVDEPTFEYESVSASMWARRLMEKHHRQLRRQAYSNERSRQEWIFNASRLSPRTLPYKRER